MTLATRPATNGHAKPGGPRHRVEIDRHELVGAFMDGDTLATEAAYANGAALQYLIGLPRDAATEQAILALHETHDKLTALIRRMRLSSGLYDKPSQA